MRNQLGTLVDELATYLRRYNKELKGLDYFLIDTTHSDYLKKYRSLGFEGITELADHNHRGYREGTIKLADKIYLGFTCKPQARENFVIGFAKNKEALDPYILNVAQDRVFTSNYEGDLIPHEIREPSSVLFLNDNQLEKFKRDINSFLGAESFYQGRGLAYKRGALLYGFPGNGKTSLISWAAKQFDKVFVIDVDDASSDVARNINLLCRKDESKLIILEDLDALQDHTSSLLNFIDGSVHIPKAYFVGTTNYPERLHENILSRPSRFDLFMEIGRPNEASREKLLRHHLPDLPEEEYTELVGLTKGLNASYFQEIATVKHSYEFAGDSITVKEIIEECKRRAKLNKTKDFQNPDKSTVGFGGRT